MNTTLNDDSLEVNELLRWRKQADQEKWEKLAAIADTSTGYLDQLAYGFRRASADKAKDISNATMTFRSPKPVTKEDIVFAPLRSKPKKAA
ncbi:TPA: transcriptional regulator [Yersinia enterocolitica]|uniref:hypothetical protein n=1 Tax=Yersinia TaxID=629 RepID=UPI0005E2CD9C|nr:MULTISPECIES: hypothetical protein [Yersinia]ELI8100257.1 transcriptional regulator [Yersinia enterocolitica]MBW5861834.1 transcriptional regulator [Yersinia enterocolitica]MBW5871479.1 transcriptional regulator [Yersinia enterocolitica]CNI86117.1 Uncharacterised protein [Yersinia intermedia]HDL6709157.1 transcriptional regulator [Yersinia enterocolitica]